MATSTAVGWLYWFRSNVAWVPGPRVQDALPLDELPLHAALPLLVVVPTFGVAALLLGYVARAVSLDRIGGALTLFVGTGCWLFIMNATSLYLVRQVGFSEAFRSAATNETIYLAATLSGLAGAVLCSPSRRYHRWASVAVAGVAAAGIIDLVAAIEPRSIPAGGLLAQVAPTFVPRAAHAFAIPLGVALLLSARGLLRRNHRAWWIALSLAGCDVVVHLLAGPDSINTAYASLLILIIVAGRREFSVPGDPHAHPRAMLRFVGVTLLTVSYGAIALAINRTASDLSMQPVMDLWSAFRSLVGLPLSDDLLLRGDFASWFPWSEVLLFTFGVAWAAAGWLAPWRHRHLENATSDERARQIVARHGTDTLAPFALRADKSRFFYSEHPESVALGSEVLIAYRVVRGVALISGDAIGPTALVPGALLSFIDYAGSRGWQVAVLGASRRFLALYGQLGFRTMYHGDEAIIDVGTFTLNGGKMKSVRQAAHRLSRQGYAVDIGWAGDMSPAIRSELIEVERVWLRQRARKGFVMELDTLFRLDGKEALFVIGRNASGEVKGFLHIAVCPSSRMLSLSSMPRQPDTPNGFNAWLITETVAWARNENFGALSLNFSPFAGLLGLSVDLSPAQRIERELLRRVKQVLSLQLDNLLLFNQQFDPQWEPRFVAFWHRSGLPRVMLAAMAAEHYLPFADWMRGSEWNERSEELLPAPERELVSTGTGTPQQ